MNCILKKVNLSNNSITCKSARKLKEVLIDNYELDELYLHWNQIKGPGGVDLAAGLLLNENLKVLDLS